MTATLEGPPGFDPYAVTLAGPRLVEASAGTGKTYAIGSMVLRLLLEPGLDGREPPTIDRVLVVTFTRAATAELRDRLRGRLLGALDLLDDRPAGERAAGSPADPALAVWLQQRAAVDPRAARERLRRALRDFDDAAVFTIHGFCQRMLHEFAFESRVDFRAELTGDDTQLVTDAAYDFWADLAYAAPSIAVAWLRSDGGLAPDALAALARTMADKPHLERVPPRPDGSRLGADLAALQGRYDQAWAAAASAWRSGGREALEVVARAAEAGDIHRSTYKPEKVRGQWPDLLDAVLARPPAWSGPDACKPMDALAAVAGKANQGRRAPEHPFLAACADLVGALTEIDRQLDAWGLGVRHDLSEWLARALPPRKREARTVSFGDLLHQLHAALSECTPAAERLASRMRGRFHAALIDEFQDTDRVQYEIFRMVFAPAPAPPAGGSDSGAAAPAPAGTPGDECEATARDGSGGGPDAPIRDAQPLLLVGDPKQAIYAFRGADVFAYLEAVRLVGPDRRHTLRVNRRSDPALVAALEAVWSAVPRPFLFEQIRYESVRAHHLDRVDPPGPALELAYMPAAVADPEATREGKPVAVDRARRAAARAAATAVARLLSGDARIPGEDGEPRPVRGSDVAVLTRSNREAARVQSVLRDHGVAGVLTSQASVLDSPESGELRRILGAILDPSDGAQVRSALVTPELGLGASELLALTEDERAWDECVEGFRRWQGVWRRSGLLPAVRHMMDERRVGARLLAMVAGERRLTNFMHLAELLHGAAFAQGLGPEALLAWFDRVLADPELRQRALGETAELRLESDELAVRVLTVHKSKGLEYPFVFCPALWSGLHGPPKAVVAYHELLGDRRQRLDIGRSASGEAAVAARLEALSEDLRLLYVAMTRARHRLWLAWGPFNESETGALAYLWSAAAAARAGDAPEGDDPADLAAWQQRVATEAKDRLTAAAAAAHPEDDPLWMGLLELETARPDAIRALYLGPGDVRKCAPGREPAAGEAEGRGQGLATGEGTPPGLREVRVPPTQRLVRSSFTALARGEREAVAADPADGVDHDAGQAGAEEPDGVDDLPDAEVAVREPSAAAEDGIVPLADLQAGARLGSGLHALMEGLDFGQPERWPSRAYALADARVLPRDAVEPLLAALPDILGTPLGVGPLGFALSQVSRADRIDEMGYVLPAAVSATGARLEARGGRVGLRAIAQVLSEHPGGAVPLDYPARLRGLPALPFSGWLSGALDMVFRHDCPDGRALWFLLDWKSNRLGRTWSDYAPERLTAAMSAHHYFLQAHLYALALHRHLRRRLPGYAYESHFGGTVYLFVRGMRPDVPGSGVLFDRPPEGRMEALDRLLEEGRP